MLIRNASVGKKCLYALSPAEFLWRHYYDG